MAYSRSTASEQDLGFNDPVEYEPLNVMPTTHPSTEPNYINYVNGASSTRPNEEEPEELSQAKWRKHPPIDSEEVRRREIEGNSDYKSTGAHQQSKLRTIFEKSETQTSRNSSINQQTPGSTKWQSAGLKGSQASSSQRKSEQGKKPTTEDFRDSGKLKNENSASNPLQRTRVSNQGGKSAFGSSFGDMNPESSQKPLKVPYDQASMRLSSELKEAKQKIDFLTESLQLEMVTTEEQRSYIEVLKQIVENKLHGSGMIEMLQSMQNTGRTDLHDVLVELQSVSRKIEESKMEAKAVQDQADQMSMQTAKIEGKNEELARQLEEQRKTNEKLGRELDEAMIGLEEMKNIQNENGELHEKMKEIQEENARLRENLKEQKNQAQIKTKDVQMFEESLKKKKEELSERKKDLSLKGEELDRVLENQGIFQEEMERMKKELERAEEKVRRMKSEARDKEDEASRMAQRERNAVEKISFQQKVIDNLKGDVEGLKEKNSNISNQLLDSESQRVDIGKEKEKMMKEFKEETEKLGYVIQDLERCLEIEKTKAKEESEEASAFIREVSRELESLQEELEKSDAEKREMEAVIMGAKKQLSELQSSLQEENKKREKAEESLVKSTSQNSFLAQQLNDLREDTALLKSEVNAQINEVQLLIQEKNELDMKNQEIIAQKEDYEDLICEIIDRAKRVLAKSKKKSTFQLPSKMASESKRDIFEQIEATQAVLSSLEEEIGSILTREKENEGQIEQLKKEIEERERKALKSQSSIDEFVKTVEELQENADLLAKEIEKTKRNSQIDQEALQNELRKARNEIVLLREENDRLVFLGKETAKRDQMTIESIRDELRELRRQSAAFQNEKESVEYAFKRQRQSLLEQETSRAIEEATGIREKLSYFERKLAQRENAYYNESNSQMKSEIKREVENLRTVVKDNKTRLDGTSDFLLRSDQNERKLDDSVGLNPMEHSRQLIFSESKETQSSLIKRSPRRRREGGNVSEQLAGRPKNFYQIANSAKQMNTESESQENSRTKSRRSEQSRYFKLKQSLEEETLKWPLNNGQESNIVKPEPTSQPV